MEWTLTRPDVTGLTTSRDSEPLDKAVRQSVVLSRLDDLVHPLMAETEALGDLAQRAALDVEPPNRVAVVGAGPLELVLGLEHAVAGVAGVAKGGGIQGRHGV